MAGSGFFFRDSRIYPFVAQVNKLKAAYNSRQPVNLSGSEPAVVASLLKLFLRELPDPVLTQRSVSTRAGHKRFLVFKVFRFKGGLSFKDCLPI